MGPGAEVPALRTSLWPLRSSERDLDLGCASPCRWGKPRGPDRLPPLPASPCQSLDGPSSCPPDQAAGVAGRGACAPQMPVVSPEPGAGCKVGSAKDVQVSALSRPGLRGPDAVVVKSRARDEMPPYWGSLGPVAAVSPLCPPTPVAVPAPAPHTEPRLL